MTDMENKILGGFIRLLENHPIEQITVTEICKESGVSKRSFYNYYSIHYYPYGQLQDFLHPYTFSELLQRK